MKPILRSSIFAFILLVGQAFGGYFIGPLFYALGIPIHVRLVLAQVIMIIVPCIIYFSITKQPIRETLRLNPIGIADVFIIILIGILIQPLAAFIGAVANLFFPNVISQVVNLMGNLSLPVKLGVMALTPAICEEISMRGIYLSGYKKVDIKIGALMSGFIFGLLHMNFQQFFYAFALGVLLAYLVHITNSIFSSILCHFTFNGVSVLMSTIAARYSKVDNSAAKDLVNLPLNEKVLSLLSLLVLALIFTTFAGMLLWALSSINKKRNEKRKLTYSVSITDPEQRHGDLQGNGERERVLNWSFAASIAVFIVSMIRDAFLG